MFGTIKKFETVTLERIKAKYESPSFLVIDKLNPMYRKIGHQTKEWKNNF